MAVAAFAMPPAPSGESTSWSPILSPGASVILLARAIALMVASFATVGNNLEHRARRFRFDPVAVRFLSEKWQKKMDHARVLLDTGARKASYPRGIARRAWPAGLNN